MSTRVAVFAPNWLGDAVMAFPALAAIRHAHAGATLIVVARPSVAALFGAARIDQVVTVTRRHEVRQVAEARADIAILLPNSFASAWIAWRAGIGERWGYVADWRRPLLTRGVKRPRRRGHHAEYYLELIDRLGMARVGAPGTLAVPETAAASVAGLLARRGCPPEATVVGIAPGAAYGRAKRWPPERFAGLVARLAERASVTAVLVGGAKDVPSVREVERWLARWGVERERAEGQSPRWISLAGETGLLELLALAARSAVFVSNDSGAMHAAAAVGTPVTAIFGATDEHATSPLVFGAAEALPTDPGEAGPHTVVTAQVWCRPCMLRECPIDHRCMTRISADRVFEAVAAQIDRRRADQGRA